MMEKRNVKGDVTIREFYSDIPMKSWIEKKEELADAFNCHFVGEQIFYGGKSDGKRIVIVTAKGRKPVPRGNLYDDEF